MKVYRSVLVGVTFAYLLSLLCGFFVARVISEKSYAVYVTPTFEAMDGLELDEACAAFGQNGKTGLHAYLARLDAAFGGKHYLLSAQGIDFLSGISRQALLPEPPATGSRGYVGSVFHLTRRSDDGQYWFAVVGSNNQQGPATWAYFLVCFLVTTGLLVFSLVYLVFPLRHIRDAMIAFGAGDMNKRILSMREDEVGQLSSSFNGMAEQIDTSFRSERALLQDVSHELRAPLARLGLAVHLAKQANDDPLLEQIDGNVQRLASLVGEITTFHQTWSAVEKDSPLETLDLGEAVRQIIQENAIEADLHAVSIAFTPKQVFLQAARPDLINRVLGNVLRNAILHSWQGGRVDIFLEEANEAATVTVRDYGRGVPPELLDRIFEPFYREQHNGQAAAGLGLGLSIARRGAQWHGGTLHAELAYPGLRIIANFPRRRVALNKS